jgi:hypothetical protein
VRCALDGPRLEENGELGRPGEDVDGALAWPSKEDAGDRGSRTRRRTRSSGGSPRGARRTLVVPRRRRRSLIEEKQGFASLGESEARVRLERGWVFLGLAHER